MSALISVRLVPPCCLKDSPVNTVYLPGRTEFRIDRTSRTDRDLIAAFNAIPDQTHETFAKLIDPWRPPVVRYHLTRDADLFDVDPGPEQVDVYINTRLMPLHIAEQLAAHTTYFVHTRMAGERRRWRT